MAGKRLASGEKRSVKIAAVSEDGVTISQHFGRAPFYVVVTVEEGKVVAVQAGRGWAERPAVDPRGLVRWGPNDLTNPRTHV